MANNACDDIKCGTEGGTELAGDLSDDAAHGERLVDQVTDGSKRKMEDSAEVEVATELEERHRVPERRDCQIHLLERDNVIGGETVEAHRSHHSPKNEIGNCNVTLAKLVS